MHVAFYSASWESLLRPEKRKSLGFRRNEVAAQTRGKQVSSSNNRAATSCWRSFAPALQCRSTARALMSGLRELMFLCREFDLTVTLRHRDVLLLPLAQINLARPRNLLILVVEHLSPLRQPP